MTSFKHLIKLSGTNTIIVNYDWLVRTIQVYSRSSHGSTYSCFEDYISAGSQSNMFEARHLRYHCWILVCGRLGAPERISPALTKPFIKPKKKKTPLSDVASMTAFLILDKYISYINTYIQIHERKMHEVSPAVYYWLLFLLACER